MFKSPKVCRQLCAVVQCDSGNQDTKTDDTRRRNIHASNWDGESGCDGREAESKLENCEQRVK